MSVITAAIYDRLAGDATLTGLLATYGDAPAVFTMDPAPGDATLPYIVTAGEVTQTPWDTKQTRGRELIRDVRCYAADNGSAETVEAIAERVRALLHRHELSVSGYQTVVAECNGPITADELDAYGRIISISLKIDGG